MADQREKNHHRSKSQLAKSLLSKVASRADSTKDDTSEAADSSRRPSISAISESNVSIASKSSRHRHLSTTMSSATNVNAPPDGRNPAYAASSNNNDSPSSPADTSLEQSVLLFKYFEILRNGDKNAIAKAFKEQQAGTAATLEGTTILHVAIQCAEVPTIEYVLSNTLAAGDAAESINSKDKEGNTPLHLASRLGRTTIVRLLLDQEDVNDSITNFQGQTPLDLAYSPEIYQQLQLARSLFVDSNVQKVHSLVAQKDYKGIEQLLGDSRVKSALDVNGIELTTDKTTQETGGTLLHEAARKKDVKLIQLLLMNGADPFRRDRKGKLPQDVTKDEKTRHILKKSPAAERAQRSVQEKGILGSASTSQLSGPSTADNPLGGKESREMKGYLKKWTNYTGGWKLRWFVLEEGVLSYYKHQDDAGAACRGAINMRIAKLNMDPQDKLRFEIQGKSSVKYHLKANHQVEAKRWYWALNNAIQWSKDEDKEEQKRVDREAESIRQARLEQDKRRDGDSISISSRARPSGGKATLAPPQPSTAALSSAGDDDDVDASVMESVGPATRMTSRTGGDAFDVEDDLEDDNSSHEAQPVQKDALNITAQSLRMQLDLLGQVAASLTAERKRNPNLTFADANVTKAISAYESAVGNLRGLIGDFLRIANDRDAYWQYRLDRETNIRRMWEESMAKVAKEQIVLETKMEESEDKRKRTKRALRDALENLNVAEGGSRPLTPLREVGQPLAQGNAVASPADDSHAPILSPNLRKSTLAEFADLSDNDSDVEDEFFDAVDAGEVEVVELAATVEKEAPVPQHIEDSRESKLAEIQKSFQGYEEPVRKRLKLDADNRPKVSLWAVLKSMIGKDMTKMTLPVSFNEPTSLLQRAAEDMEYSDLLDTAANIADSTERMVHVAAFASSEYASTIGRVAKPFNPLLAETFEYVRPDKEYRYLVEQVSHHPPLSAAYAESPRWDYYGEQNVKSKFYGKSFDFQHLGTWFLRLRPSTGGSELYSWKKCSSAVVGIITGSPVVDNYGTMEIKNWNTGEVCILDFKPRGWKASSAYIVSGRVLDKDGRTRWSIGGRWNDKIYARLTPGFENNEFSASDMANARAGRTDSTNSSQAFLIWQANPRPTGIPFNLTPFGVTLNAIPDSLKPYIAPTDTRLRPDQRAMEDGEYDFAATEKNRVEEKQRATRRRREQSGEHFEPRWFTKAVDETTGVEFWKFNNEYWNMREAAATGGKWKGLEDIF